MSDQELPLDASGVQGNSLSRRVRCRRVYALASGRQGQLSPGSERVTHVARVEAALSEGRAALAAPSVSI